MLVRLVRECVGGFLDHARRASFAAPCPVRAPSPPSRSDDRGIADLADHDQTPVDPVRAGDDPAADGSPGPGDPFAPVGDLDDALAAEGADHGPRTVRPTGPATEPDPEQPSPLPLGDGGEVPPGPWHWRWVWPTPGRSAGMALVAADGSLVLWSPGGFAPAAGPLDGRPTADVAIAIAGLPNLVRDAAGADSLRWELERARAVADEAKDLLNRVMGVVDDEIDTVRPTTAPPAEPGDPPPTSG